MLALLFEEVVTVAGLHEGSSSIIIIIIITIISTIIIIVFIIAIKYIVIVCRVRLCDGHAWNV